MNLKRTLIAVAGFLLMTVLVGCQSSDKVIQIKEDLTTLKEQGCGKLSPEAKVVLVAIIKTKVRDYPKNGICDPDWVRDVLIDKLGLLETANVIYNQPAQLGYSSGSGNRQLDQPEASGLPLDIVEEDSKSSRWLRNRFGINTEIASLVYESSLKAYPGSSSNTRLLLYTSMPGHDQKAGRLNHPRSYGLCSLYGTDVEAQCGLSGGSYWRQG